MSDASARVDTSLLDLSPAERDKRDIAPEDVNHALLDVIRHGSKQEKILTGCTFPSLDLSYHDIDGENNHPVVFRDCMFEGGNRRYSRRYQPPISVRSV